MPELDCLVSLPNPKVFDTRILTVTLANPFPELTGISRSQEGGFRSNVPYEVTVGSSAVHPGVINPGRSLKNESPFRS